VQRLKSALLIPFPADQTNENSHADGDRKRNERAMPGLIGEPAQRGTSELGSILAKILAKARGLTAVRAGALP